MKIQAIHAVLTQAFTSHERVKQDFLYFYKESNVYSPILRTGYIIYNKFEAASRSSPADIC